MRRRSIGYGKRLNGLGSLSLLDMGLHLGTTFFGAFRCFYRSSFRGDSMGCCRLCQASRRIAGRSDVALGLAFWRVAMIVTLVKVSFRDGDAAEGAIAKLDSIVAADSVGTQEVFTMLETRRNHKVCILKK
jgi:hypothetical protein